MKKAENQNEFLSEMNEQVEPIETNEVLKSEVELTRHSLSDDKFIDGLFNELESKKTSEGQELTSNYLDFNTWKEGEERNFIFSAMTTFTKPDTGEVMPAVQLLDRERKSYIAASTVIVQSLAKCKNMPAAIRIKYIGKVKSTRGSYFDVQVFNF